MVPQMFALKLHVLLGVLQEFGASGDQEGPVRSGEARAAAHGGDHAAVLDVGQAAALGGVSG